MTAWKPSLSYDDDAKKKKSFKRDEDSFNLKRGGNKGDFVVKDDAQYFEDLLFGEECTDEEEFQEEKPPVPPKRREHHRDERFKSRRSQATTPELPHEEQQKQKQEFENEEYEEMKDVNAIRRLTRPETEVEREVLEIARTSFQRISSINNNKNKKKGALSAGPNINNNNEKTIAVPPTLQITRRESEDEEREREKCFRLKQTIEEMFAKTGREDREVRVATSSKFRGACALRNLVHSYVWIDPEYARMGERAYNEEEMMTMQGQQHAVGSASSYSSRMSSSSSSLPPNELNLQRIIVEADLRSHFVIANATPRYQRLLDELPSEFVGTFSRLLEIIDFMAVKLNSSFAARKMDTPPWRRAKSIASKWSMPIEEQLINNNNGSSSASGSPMNHHATTTTSGSSTMYQHQQQNISPQHKHTST
ncbi:unnamed protein product [Bathycoccus prasinos]|jgi:uncharacterized protein (TIGR01615 family)